MSAPIFPPTGTGLQTSQTISSNQPNSLKPSTSSEKQDAVKPGSHADVQDKAIEFLKKQNVDTQSMGSSLGNDKDVAIKKELRTLSNAGNAEASKLLCDLETAQIKDIGDNGDFNTKETIPGLTNDLLNDSVQRTQNVCGDNVAFTSTKDAINGLKGESPRPTYRMEVDSETGKCVYMRQILGKDGKSLVDDPHSGPISQEQFEKVFHKEAPKTNENMSGANITEEKKKKKEDSAISSTPIPISFNQNIQKKKEEENKEVKLGSLNTTSNQSVNVDSENFKKN
jgi:hypothetical protein